jgi:hypothetical protein
MTDADVVFIERYGPSYMQVMRVLADITRMDADRARELLLLSADNADEVSAAALTIAERYGIEKEAVRASEDCRREVWNVMWDGSTRAETWTLAWCAARAGLGAAVAHLVERSEAYTFAEHLTLLGPWRATFVEDAT